MTLEGCCRTEWDTTHSMCSINVRFCSQGQNPVIILEQINLLEFPTEKAWSHFVRIKWDKGGWSVLHTVENSLQNKKMIAVWGWQRRIRPLILWRCWGFSPSFTYFSLIQDLWFRLEICAPDCSRTSLRTPLQDHPGVWAATGCPQLVDLRIWAIGMYYTCLY